jgi:hypothetical protein
MTLPYDRKFSIGRQSEQLMNEELHKIHESLKHLLDMPAGKHSAPEAKLQGSLWLDQAKNELNYYDKPKQQWVNVFKDKFQIVDQITNQLPPDTPVLGQLWIYNGVLLYWTGSQWEPVKALTQDGSQFNLSIFENFLLISPLWKIGNMVVEDSNIAEYEKAERQYMQGKLDALTDSQLVGNGTVWVPGERCDINEPQIPVLDPEGKVQFIVPNIDVDRFFVNGKLDMGYSEVSKVCIQYPRTGLINKTPSLVHVNPGKLTGIKKRLIKIDRTNPKIFITADNTEFYGFRKDEYLGRFLVPSPTQEEGDYIIQSDGVYLSYNASQNYDYVLAVKYEFSWLKATGKLNKSSNQDKSSSYYIQNYMGPLNIFVEGMNLEDPYCKEDNLSQVITTTENTNDLEVSVMHSAKREYGFIRQIDIRGRGVIKTLQKYRQPLIFVNGEAMHPALGGVEISDNTIYVQGALRNMAWSIIELEDTVTAYDMYYDANIVSDMLPTGEVVIRYDNTKIKADDGVVLFVDGLLVKKEDVIKDHVNSFVTTSGLTSGQDYILLKDKYRNLYDETKLFPALAVGKLSESLVYMNGLLLCNDTAIATVLSKEQEMTEATNGEVKMFLASDLDRTVGEYCTYDQYNERWIPLDTIDIANLNYFAYSYENTPRAIKMNIANTKNDIINVFAFNYANAIEHPLIIRTISAIDQDVINIKEVYIPNIGSLSVWVNGVRQFRVAEFLDGTGFQLPQKVTGRVTYVIENPEHGKTQVAQRELLTNDNLAQGSVNVYKTIHPLYPGRVTIYINGVRQPMETYTILDNYTILFNDKTTMLVGSRNNFPDEKVIVRGAEKIVHHTSADEILVEVKQSFERRENTIKLNRGTNYDISIAEYNLPIDILEAEDEIMIFVDGLFHGLMNLEGYVKDRHRGVITLLNSDVVDSIVSDPLHTFLASNCAANLAYKNTHGGAEYIPKTKQLILEWR